MSIKLIIDDIDKELDNLRPIIEALEKDVRDNYAKYIAKSSADKFAYETRRASLREAKCKLQVICNHEWDSGKWDHYDHYYTCKICGLVREDE